MKRFFAILTTIVLLLNITACSTEQRNVEDVSSNENTVDKNPSPKLSAEEIYELIAPSTVEINAIGDGFESTGTGSFIDSNGVIVTNYHVIESCHTINIKTQNGTTHKVESVLGFDKERDLAIIKADYINESFVEIRSEKVKTGEKVYTLGSSLGLTGTLSEGIISSDSREIEGFEFIQTTAPVSSGNSGGPLVDEYGKVIGIITGAFTEGQNINFAIPTSAINKINREKIYSINDFFQNSQGKVVEQIKEKVEDELVEDENYTPVDMGFFESLSNLKEAALRNPNDFKRSVKVSVRGTIIRLVNDDIVLFTEDKESYEVFRLMILIERNDGITAEDLLGLEGSICYVNMMDDTKNRVLTGDKVIVNGVYRYFENTMLECTYKFVD